MVMDGPVPQGASTRKPLQSVRSNPSQELARDDEIPDGAVPLESPTPNTSVNVDDWAATSPMTADRMLDDAPASDSSGDDASIDQPDVGIVRNVSPPVAVRSGTPAPANRSLNVTPRPRRASIAQPAAAVKNDNWPGMVMIFSSVLLAMVALVYSFVQNTDQPTGTCDKFLLLEDRYPNINEMLWPSLTVSVNRATSGKPKEPGTFLFLHNSTDVTIDDFLRDVLAITSECFGGKEPIQLKSDYFKSTAVERDYGTVIDQQRGPLQQRGILVVRNLQDIPPKTAQAFHSICDAHEPLVDRVVVYFTLDVAHPPVAATVQDEQPNASAEQILKELWQDELSPSVLQPLITRVTENVFKIV